MYDGRRADRCTSNWGLEARVPLLDLEFIMCYWGIDEKLRHPDTFKFEKYWLRKAFDGMDLLPDEILWRKKEAFSDGVSSKTKSWYTVIQEHVEKEFDNDSYVDIYKDNKPITTEAKFYRQIFTKEFGILRDDIIPHYWLPKYDKNGNHITSYVDPSARTLELYD
jgi:asparagine synthase (glutamine-hydrolysing)